VCSWNTAALVVMSAGSAALSRSVVVIGTKAQSIRKVSQTKRHCRRISVRPQRWDLGAIADDDHEAVKRTNAHHQRTKQVMF
jgi:hypothetical protein